MVMAVPHVFLSDARFVRVPTGPCASNEWPELPKVPSHVRRTESTPVGAGHRGGERSGTPLVPTWRDSGIAAAIFDPGRHLALPGHTRAEPGSRSLLVDPVGDRAVP